MPKEIQINHKGSVLTTIVDDEDYPLLSRHTWFLRKGIDTGNYYVSTILPQRNGKQPILQMHYFIIGVGNADHRNGNTLDNQKENLRPATRQENGWNKGKPKACRHGACSSQFKGVSYKPIRGKDRWLAMIKHVEPGAHKSTGRNIRIGYFWDEVDAAKAYNNKVVEIRGEWAWVNPIPGEVSDAG